MSNSVKKGKCYKFVSGSNASWKRYANRKFRRQERIAVSFGREPRAYDTLNNLWMSPLDGSGTYDNSLKNPIKVIRSSSIRYKLTENPDWPWDTRKAQRK